MKLLSNENFPLPSVKALRKSGHDILSITEESPGISDEQVLKIAFNQNRILVTFDGDYGELAFVKNLPLPPAILYLRVTPTHPLEAFELVQNILTNEVFTIEGNFIVIERGSIRKRPLHTE